MPTQSKPLAVTREERELIRRIKNHRLSPALHKRHAELIRKRQDETLTAPELKELIRLTDKAEQMTVERVEWLRELARLRDTTLSAVADELGIKAPRNDFKRAVA